MAKRWRDSGDAGMGIRGFHRQHWPAIGGSNLGRSAIAILPWPESTIPTIPTIEILKFSPCDASEPTCSVQEGIHKKTPPSHGVDFILEPSWLCHEWWRLCLHHLCPEVGLL